MNRPEETTPDRTILITLWDSELASDVKELRCMFLSTSEDELKNDYRIIQQILGMRGILLGSLKPNHHALAFVLVHDIRRIRIMTKALGGLRWQDYRKQKSGRSYCDKEEPEPAEHFGTCATY